MANVNGLLENKTIHFVEKDKSLNKWRSRVLNEDSSNMSRLIRVALRYYMKNGTSCCVGRVFMSEQDWLLSERHTVCISLRDSPDIVAWFRLVKQAGAKPAAVIKSILAASIQLVDSPANEWIPSELELLQLELSCSGEQILPVGSMTETVQISSGSVRNNPNLPPENSIQQPAVPPTVSQTNRSNISGNTVSQNSSPKKKKPRAYAFSGKRFTS